MVIRSYLSWLFILTLWVLLLLQSNTVSAQQGNLLYKGKIVQQLIKEKRDTSGINPFDTAFYVELIQYSNRMAWWSKLYTEPYPLVLDGRLTIPQDSFLSRVTLTKEMVADFRAALYEDHICAEWMVSGCYEPRHLLAFYRQDGYVIGSIEICVTCSGGYISKGLRPVIFCPDRNALLAALVKHCYL